MAAALPPRGKRHKEQLSFSLRNNSVDIQLMPNLFPLCQTSAWTEPQCTSSPLSKPGKTALENYTVWARSHFWGFMQCLELFCLRFWGLKRSPWKWMFDSIIKWNYAIIIYWPSCCSKSKFICFVEHRRELLENTLTTPFHTMKENEKLVGQDPKWQINLFTKIIDMLLNIIWSQTFFGKELIEIWIIVYLKCWHLSCLLLVDWWDKKWCLILRSSIETDFFQWIGWSSTQNRSECFIYK